MKIPGVVLYSFLRKRAAGLCTLLMSFICFCNCVGPMRNIHHIRAVWSNYNKRLHDVFFDESDYASERDTFHCFVGLPANDADNHHPFLKAKMRIMNFPRYEHIPTKNPDFFQVSKNQAP